MNILFLTHRLPYAPNRGDRTRAYHLLREMSSFARVSLFSLVHDDEEASRAAAMPFAHVVATARVNRAQNMLRGAWRLAATTEPLTHALLDAPAARAGLDRVLDAGRPDLVVAFCSSMARFAFEPPLDDLPLVVDLVDVDSQKWLSLGRRAGAPRNWILGREARTLAAFERAVAARARAVLVVNDREAAALRVVAPQAPVHVVQNGIDVAAFAPAGPPVEDPVVIFCGVMDYEPNVEAVCWFADRAWPHVRAKIPNARCLVVGASPAKAVTALASRDASIEVTGRVDAVQPYLQRSAVSIAPLQLARGVQNKVLEALAAGLPVVVTSAVRAGLPQAADRGCLTADEPEAFARCTLDLLALTGRARRNLAAEARVDRLSWPLQLAPLKEILKESVGIGSGAPGVRMRAPV
jgi:sugar transferase (PEP-CTERM/EpsH1 system associated)